MPAETPTTARHSPAPPAPDQHDRDALVPPIEPVAGPAAALFGARHRVTIEEFHRMVDRGVFGDEPRVELIEGVIVDKVGKNPPHIQATDLVQYLLIRLVPDGFFFSMGNPMAIEGRDSEPEPDAMILRGLLRDFAGRRRTPRDAALVIEVSDTTYATDRRIKWASYAASGVPVYWILDLNRRCLEIHADPTGEGLEASYRSSRVYLETEEAPLVLDGREVARFAVSAILP